VRLTEEQLSIIKEVRNLMAHGEHAPRYICTAIGRIIKAKRDAGSISVEQADTLKHQLCGAIIWGINSMVTFGGFMILTCPVIAEMVKRDEDWYDDTIHLARLTWLDWIIETGEIKPEKLLGE
jgi:hypothetical protein